MNSIRQTIQKLAILVLTGSAFYSCRTTEEVHFNVTIPAPVTIPNYVKKVGIINRSVISDSNKVRKKIDNILSAKGPLLDKECSNECIRGLKDGLQQGNIFQNIVFLDSVNINNSFPGAFPSPLSWDEIEEICKANNVDALFSLELFHTGNRLNVPISPAGLMVSGAMAVAENTRLESKVSTGWRIYDPQNKLILDEFPIAENITLTGGLLNPLDEASSLMNHKEAVMGVSYQIGQSYAGRILPYIIRVCHEFYIRANTNFKIARRMADAGDWKNAADLWTKETTNVKVKIRARAYYNMAIICEINGDVDGAIGWAKKSYETDGRRLALEYLNDLQNRKAQDDLLKYQAHGQ